jgi:hypothetical protein
MPQYHFLDESGDPGQRSGNYFALALVQVAVHQPIVEIANVRRDLNLAGTFEFKYHKATKAQREVFFRSIQSLSFRVRATVIDKNRVPLELRLQGHPFIVEWTTRLILRATDLDMANDTLVMDGAVPSLRRALRIRLSDECRRLKRERPFAKIITADSRRDDGLQLADMIVGAVRQYVIEDEQHFYTTFANKVADLWRAP